MRKQVIKEGNSKNRKLPHTRVQVFFDLLKYQKLHLVNLSLLTFLFFLPLFADVIYFWLLSLAAITSQAPTSVLFSLFFYMFVLSIPCLGIAYLGLGGSFESARRLIFQEGLTLKEDFWSGIKNNFKHALPLGLIVGVSFFVAGSGSLYLSFFSSLSPIWMGIGIGLCLLQFLLIASASIYFLCLDAVYSLSFGYAFKTSISLFFVGLFPNLLLFVSTLGILLVLLFINTLTQYIGIALFAFASSLGILAWSLFANRQFDRYINQENYPDQVGKGLYKESENK